MELDQILFQKISNFFIKRKNKPSQEVLKKTAFLDEKRGQYTIMARALTGLPIDIVTAEKEGGWKNNKFFLPGQIVLLEKLTENETLYWFRVFYLSYLVKISSKLNTKAPTFSINPNGKLNQLVLGALFNEFPHFSDQYQSFKKSIEDLAFENKVTPNYSLLLGKWMSQEQQIDEKVEQTPDLNSTQGLPNPKTEKKAKPVDEVNSIFVDKEQQEEYMLTHNFEKVETLEEFNGNWRDFDGDDDLNEHGDALDQVTMKHTVRVNDQTHSVYQSEFVSNGTVPESSDVEEKEGISFLYDEWDIGQRKYLKDYCTVYAHQKVENDENYIQETLNQNNIILRNLRKKFASYFNKYKQVRKLNQGEEMDMDSLTDLFMDIKAGTTADEKIYNSKKKRLKDVSILFLLDLSLSSDGYVENKRIIDIEKQVAILIGQVLNEFGINFQIDGFNSKTRNNCSYYTYKAFASNWEKTKAKVGTIKPEGYTRIGPALRHAHSLIKNEDSRSKWILLLSDGKPNDYDKYEGKYGIADTRQAIREMKQDHVSIHTFAIEEKAKFYLPLIFGKSNYNVLANPKELINGIGVFCRKIMSSSL